MRIRAIFGAAVLAAVTLGPVHAARAQDLILDTGPGSSSTIGAISFFNDGTFFQYVAMKVSFDEPTDIGRVDAWFRGSGDIQMKLRANGGNNLPGAELESETFSVSFNPSFAWVAFGGIEWSVDPGNYWITFETDVNMASGSFPTGVPIPLDAYAFWSDGNPSWAFLGSTQKLGLRVYTPASPEPVLVPDKFPTIQSAIDFVTTGQVIEVAPGTYNEAINFNGKTITVRSAGGADVTIIDATGLNQPVVRVPNGSGSATRLEGFTITGGVHTTGLAQGGGVSVEAFGGSTFITVADCLIAGNVAESGGGTAVVFGAEAVFENCTFDDNDVSDTFASGGGAYINTGTAEFNNCQFVNNDASGSGGAMNVNNGGLVTATNCSFVNNTAGNLGGAVLVISSSADATFTDCTFDGNTAAQAGGVGVNNAVADFITCDFVGNVATFAGSTSGGGMQVQTNATVSITGCDFAMNEAHNGGGIQFIGFSGTGSIAESTFRNNIANNAGGGFQWLASSALVTISNTDFCGNSPSHFSGAFTDGGGVTTSAACTPDNNDPEDPELILAPGAHAGTFAGATNTGTSSCEPDGVDVFYAFTITNGPIDILIDTCGSNADTALAVFDSNDVEIGCATACAGFPCNSVTACLPLPALPNGEYLIRVSLQAGAAAGVALDFVLNFSEVEFAVPGDLNNDQVVDESDRALLCGALGSTMRDPEYIDAADFDDNGTIDELDQQAFNAILPPCNGDIVTSANFQPPPDGLINGADLAYLLGAWGMQPSCADMVTSATFQPPPDGKVDGADLAFLLGAWGSCR